MKLYSCPYCKEYDIVLSMVGMCEVTFQTMPVNIDYKKKLIAEVMFSSDLEYKSRTFKLKYFQCGHCNKKFKTPKIIEVDNSYEG